MRIAAIVATKLDSNECIHIRDLPYSILTQLEGNMPFVRNFITFMKSQGLFLFPSLFLLLIFCDSRELRETKYPSGQVQSRYYSKRDAQNNYVADGLFTSWYENGQKKMEATFHNGKLNGIQTQWYENGQKSTEIALKDDKMDGSCKSWYENGNKKEESFCKNGLRVGHFTLYHDNGQIKQDGNFVNGKLHGLGMLWLENGKKAGEVIYENGIMASCTEWHENGQVKDKFTYKNGQPDGLCTWWCENGQKKSDITYKEGVIVDSKNYSDCIIKPSFPNALSDQSLTNSGYSSTETNSSDASEAQQAVLKRLKAPSTASFVKIQSFGNRRFLVIVDAQNGFGAYIRSNYCVVLPGGDANAPNEEEVFECSEQDATMMFSNR